MAALGGNLDVNPFDVTGNRSTLASTVWPAAQVSPAQLAGLAVRAVVVETNRSASALEQARTTLELAFPDRGPAPDARARSTPRAPGASPSSNR